MRFAGLFFIAITAVSAQQATATTSDSESPFLTIPPSVPDALRFESQLTPFEAKDIAGRTWRLEDLRGKFTLLYFWGTFEARQVDAHDPHVREIIPALSNLPEVQGFYDKVRRTKNIQVLTFCGDYDYTHASEYMKERKYSFPVIADSLLIRKLFPQGANPRYWIVDRDARLSAPLRSWSLGRVLSEIERAASQKSVNQQ
jgi:hypothetical protein